MPTFAEVDINGEERTAVKLRVESRPLGELPAREGNGHHIAQKTEENATETETQNQI